MRKLSKALVSSGLCAAILVGASPGKAHEMAKGGFDTPAPRVFLFDSRQLEAVRRKIRDGDKSLSVPLARLERDAQKALSEGPFSIVNKGVTPPSGDKHDYMSQAPYFWPDPKSPNGLPYSPFPYELPWGLLTTKPGKLFLHVFKWPPKPLVLYGLKSKVNRAYLLSNKERLKFTQQADRQMDHYALNIELPRVAPDKYDSVIVLELQGEPEADTSLLQQPDLSVTLPAFLAEAHKVGDQGLRLDARGVVERWLNRDEWMNWDFELDRLDVSLLRSFRKLCRDVFL